MFKREILRQQLITDTHRLVDLVLRNATGDKSKKRAGFIVRGRAGQVHALARGCRLKI